MILPSKGSPNPQRSANAENKEAFNAGVNNSAGSAKNDKNKSKLHNYVQFLSFFAEPAELLTPALNASLFSALADL